MDAIAEQRKQDPAGKAGTEFLPADAASAGEGLPVVIAAWTGRDPETAARLVEEWLATADAEGNLSPPCPVVCALAEHVAEALPAREKFLARILPGLARCVEREFDRYDARGTGLPLWPSAREALFPAEFAPGRFTVDLAVLLSNEAAAFCRLAEGHAEFDRAIGVAEGEQRELDDWLNRNFWDEESSAFHRHDEGAESAPDLSPCGFFPLVWEGRTEAMVEGLRPRAAEADFGAWPARSRALFFALLLRTPHHGLAARMRRAARPADATPAEAAVWAALAADAAPSSFPDGIPAAVRWLDAHARGFARTLWLGGAALLVALLGWWIFHRESPAANDAAETERKARQACADGRHDRAAALYGQAARRGNEAYFRYRQAGEWMHLEQFAEAEAVYRALAARGTAAPNARLNLALAVLKQGRREEALALYRAFAEEPGAAAHPELAARARLAADLLGRQLALDREADEDDRD